ncbi:RNA polymerase sigma factor [Mucilaginibacter sp. NFR10]|jgi:RNA polymerase sigma-70 factor (ECF subfamily)|uniref:RNA polymerase sigma factor n=1 Tax=Mucilaginibacter sp. NFR10 TaxID=1566292 RepID=UPI0008714975|nr:sigma-70 family RNA polymerase sigma factor [Mucilaginibacter sp. NFR10]SCW48324.1 RNA polymerase sigma-70 factor, ECF subfamily [Mucilaginibacter sp. NFR10]
MIEIADTILLSRIREDDHSAFDLLFERYWERAYQAARARLDDEAQAQDLIQEIFIKLWQRRHSLNIQTSFEQYLLSAVRLSVISYFRSQKVTHVRLEDALQRLELLENSIHDHSGYLELEQTLEQAVKHMPEMLQKVYELRSENHSVKAIASELGLAEQTVKNYISEVLRRLRIAISEKHPEQSAAYLALILFALYN